MPGVTDRKPSAKAGGRRQLVQTAVADLREIIFAAEAGAQIGSLPEIAQRLGVGIVTVQQVARVLEHEGLLEVRRGPGGGYYGMRPDEAALERSVAAYMRTHELAYREARDMMSLLCIELSASAADCRDALLADRLEALKARIEGADTPEGRIAFEEDFATILIEMVNRPLTALLTRVTMGVYRSRQIPPVLTDARDIQAWKHHRKRVIDAILTHDAALARFEAERGRALLMRGVG